MATVNVHEIFPVHRNQDGYLHFFYESPKYVAGTVFYCIICRYLFSSMRVFREEDMSAMTMFPPSCTGLLGSPIGGGLDGGGIA